MFRVTRYEEDDDELDEYVEILDSQEHQWEAIKLSSQSQGQIEFMQGCSNWGKPLWKYGIAVSYRIDVEWFDHQSLYQTQDKILLCLDDYNDTVCKKLTTLYENGRFELVEWIDQYERKDWFPIANHLNKEDIEIIISHTVEINQKATSIKCSICNFPLQSQLWVCMDKSWYTNSFHAIIVCSEHVENSSLKATNFRPSDNHRMMSFVYEKSRRGWIPKNIYRNCPHRIEKNIYTRDQLMNKMNILDQNPDELYNDNQVQLSKYDSNDTQELFRKVCLFKFYKFIIL